MHEGKPLLTVVKSRSIDDAEPPLEPQDESLLQTLSMLCSFHTAEDLASFLFSPTFQHLTANRPPFVVFEIGVYLDHTKTLELISSNNGLVVKNLRKSLSQKTIVRDISLQVQRGQTIGLLGPNGAGKTTTFYMIMGLIQPDGGEINLDKKNIITLPMHARARLGIGYLPGRI